MTGWTRPLFSILAFWLVFRLRYICIIIHWEQHGIWRTGMISMNRRLKSAMRRFVCFMKGFIFFLHGVLALLLLLVRSIYSFLFLIYLHLLRGRYVFIYILFFFIYLKRNDWTCSHVYQSSPK